MPADCSEKARVVEVDPWKDPRWEAFLAGHPDGTIYHHPVWLKALEREYRRRTAYLACEDPDGSLLGILPLLYTRGLPFSGDRLLTGPRLSSLPRTPLAGPLSLHPSVTAKLLREAVRKTAAEPRIRLQIKACGKELSDGVNRIAGKPWRDRYVVRLAGTPGAVYTIPDGQNRATIRRGINRGVAKRVRVRLAESEAELRTWYGFYLQTMRRNLVAARPYRLFVAMWELMRPRGMMRLLVAEHHTDAGSRLIGGHIFFFFGNTVTYAFGASPSSEFALRPNDLILWQAIQDASREGYGFVDLGEVPEGDDNLARFKTKWGAEPMRLYRYYYPDDPAVDPVPEKTERAPAALAGMIWRRTPLAVTAWVGDRIYGYL
ncbi:MAG: lipid II:glycine glycyltransferase FemX [Acidobacteriota bacterium]